MVSLGSRLAMVCICGSIWVSGTGCASADRVQQLETLNRNLNAEKTELQQELYDLRIGSQSHRERLESLQGQLSTKDMLIANLQSENDGLEDKFSKLQRIAENIADRPPGPVLGNTKALPAALDAALQQFAAAHPDAIAYDPSNGALKWKSDLLFALGSDIVKQSARESLQAFSTIMNSEAARDFDLIVVGHTDNIRISQAATKAKHPTNMHLSVHRSIAAQQVLREYGVPAERVGVTGFGEYRPIAPNDTDQNRMRNRRVEMYIVPHGLFGSSPASAMAITGRDDTVK